MRGAQLAGLVDGAPPGVAEALAVVDGFDDALLPGLTRLTEAHSVALTALADAVAATPLGVPVGEAVAKVAAGTVSADHLAALAGARTALTGAVHDALLDRLDTALGRTRADWAEPEPAAPAGDPGADPAGGPGASGAGGSFGGCRSWLTEVAVAGWRGVDHDLVGAVDQVVPALLADPAARRLAVLLDGLAAELRASSPVGTMASPPVRRWADLWTRAVLLARSRDRGADDTAGGRASAGTVSGRLLPLGVDVHEHGTAVQLQVHGLLEAAGDGPARLVRVSVSAAKVDTVVGPAVWRLMQGHPVLLGALAERRGLEVTDLTLTAGGDLIWRDGQARPGEPADPFAVARVGLAGAVAPAVPPLDRHPVRIAEPVLLEGYTPRRADGTAVIFDVDGTDLAVAVDRLPGCGPLTPELVAASSACLGLVRWDAGRWLLQPVAVQAVVKRRTVAVHTGDWALGPTDPKVVKAAAKAGDTVAVLRERAGRLLRR